LEEAARIAGGDDVGLERGDELGFVVAEGGGGLRLNEIVDAGRAAADGGFGNFGEFKTGNSSEKFARLSVDPLGVIEMTGIVKGDAGAERMAFSARR